MSPAPAFLLGLLVLSGVVAAVASAPPVAAGCTPCECSVAYCEGGHTYWPQVRNLTAPATVAAGGSVAVRWRVELVDADNGSLLAREGAWSVFLAVGSANRTWSPEAGPTTVTELGKAEGGVESLPVPGSFNLTLTMPGSPLHVRIGLGLGRTWSQAEAVVAPKPGMAQPCHPGACTTFRDPPPSLALGGLALLSAGWVARHRRR